jgi:hypothetical protein
VATNPNNKEAQVRAEASFKRKEQQARDGKLATAEYEAAGVATREKTARLRKLREAKEAADQAAAAAQPPAKPAKATKAGKKK